VGPLLVLTAYLVLALTISTNSHSIATQILSLRLVEIEHCLTVIFLLSVCGGGRNASRSVHNSSDASNRDHFLCVSISEVSFIVRVQFELFRELLLSHIQSLVVKASLISSRSQICRQVIFDIDNLSHILHSVADSLGYTLRSIIRHSTGYLSGFWRRTLDLIEIELSFIQSATDISWWAL
jgi:hypothetical protein